MSKKWEGLIDEFMPYVPSIVLKKSRPWNFSSSQIINQNPNLAAENNKSNSTTGAVQVDANLQEQLDDHLHFRKLQCC